MAFNMTAMALVAEKYGDVDSSDNSAVNTFYRDRFENLDDEKKDKILAELLAAETYSESELAESGLPTDSMVNLTNDAETVRLENEGFSSVLETSNQNRNAIEPSSESYDVSRVRLHISSLLSQLQSEGNEDIWSSCIFGDAQQLRRAQISAIKESLATLQVQMAALMYAQPVETQFRRGRDTLSSLLLESRANFTPAMRAAFEAIQLAQLQVSSLLQNLERSENTEGQRYWMEFNLPDRFRSED